MKVDRHGKAKVLTTDEINLVFYEGLTNDRDRPIFAICLYTACRIKECVTLRTTDVYYRQGIVRPEIIFRKGNTKGKLATRCIPVIEDLRLMLLNYYPSPREKLRMICPALRMISSVKLLVLTHAWRDFIHSGT